MQKNANMTATERCVQERRILYEKACEEERLYYESRENPEKPKSYTLARPRISRLQSKPHKKYLQRNNWILHSAKYFKQSIVWGRMSTISALLESSYSLEFSTFGEKNVKWMATKSTFSKTQELDCMTKSEITNSILTLQKERRVTYNTMN